jgi:hypothetical protein
MNFAQEKRCEDKGYRQKNKFRRDKDVQEFFNKKRAEGYQNDADGDYGGDPLLIPDGNHDFHD